MAVKKLLSGMRNKSKSSDPTGFFFFLVHDAGKHHA